MQKVKGQQSWLHGYLREVLLATCNHVKQLMDSESVHQTGGFTNMNNESHGSTPAKKRLELRPMEALLKEKRATLAPPPKLVRH